MVLKQDLEQDLQNFLIIEKMHCGQVMWRIILSAPIRSVSAAGCKPDTWLQEFSLQLSARRCEAGLKLHHVTS